MSLTDPLADMLTRIRNATRALHETVEIPSSKMKIAVADVLKKEGYISDYKMTPDNKQGTLQITLKYHENRKSVIEHIRRISKPSVRVYLGKEEIRPVRKHLGIGIFSTTQGLITDKQARLKGIGGEYVCEVW